MHESLLLILIIKYYICNCYVDFECLIQSNKIHFWIWSEYVDNIAMSE